MGSQNIKGTGLDFIYRWQAVDAVAGALAQLDHADPDRRRMALRTLEAHTDFGFVDAGLLAHGLAARADADPTLAALQAKAAGIQRERLAALAPAGGTRPATRGARVWRSLEAWLDFLDGAARQRRAQQLTADLVAGRISHARMAVEMRALYAREKGGWLGKPRPGESK